MPMVLLVYFYQPIHGQEKHERGIALLQLLGQMIRCIKQGSDGKKYNSCPDTSDQQQRQIIEDSCGSPLVQQWMNDVTKWSGARVLSNQYAPITAHQMFQAIHMVCMI